ncbi:MAG: hypothetical protein HC882_00025 [Acidobacteria bacterium]|nr:hypothetical protein [Acidobacteriota bacterium]
MTLRLRAATASLPVRNTGLGSIVHKSRPFSKVDPRFEVNAVVLERVAIVSLDAFFIGERLRNETRDAFPELESLLLVASHTHYAPNLDPELPNLAPFDEENFQLAKQAIAETIRKALTVEARATIGYAQHADDGEGVNRRSRRLTFLSRPPFLRYGMTMNPEPRAPRDRLIRVVALGDGPSAIVWNYGVHPTSFPDDTMAHPEYAVVVREALRRRFGSNVAVLFLPGFMGDVRPSVWDSQWTLGTLARGRLHGPVFRRSFPSMDVWEAWASRIAEHVVEVAEATRPEPLETLKSAEASRTATDLLAEGDVARPFRVTALRLGHGPVIVAVSSEVVSDYARLAQSLDSAPVIPVGYEGGAVGYLPTRQMIPEGGYEVDWFAKGFSFAGRWSPRAEERFVALMKQAIDATC